jgi:hypothetical protein
MEIDGRRSQEDGMDRPTMISMETALDRVVDGHRFAIGFRGEGIESFVVGLCYGCL